MIQYIRIVIAIAIAFSLPFSIQSKNTNRLSDANIIGHVIDEMGEHVAFCQISIPSINISVFTDASGHYVIRDLKAGEYKVIASFLGFKNLQKIVKVEENKTIECNFKLIPDAFLLDQVVITSNKSDTKRRESSNLVNITSGKLLTEIGACSLADGLDFQPGVRVENDCQNCGFTQVRINGLDGHYSQILMNSRPIFSALAGVYGLEQIPANMIDRIEVMRGGGSALFGSSAIGGTINIITKDPTVNSAQVRQSLTSIGLSGSLDNSTTVNASVVSDNQKSGLMIYGQNRVRDGFDFNNDGFTEIALLNSQTLGLRGFLKPRPKTRISMEYHTTIEYRRGGDNIKELPHKSLIAEETDHTIRGGEVSFDHWFDELPDHFSIFAATQAINRKSYYGSEMDLNAYGRTNDIVATTGTQWNHPIEKFIFMPAEIMGGLEYSFNRLHDISLGYNHNVLQIVKIFSGYFQNEWKNEKCGILVGGRLDNHSIIDNPIFSPRINVRYNPSNEYNFRLSYSTGFRAPQAYDEDFHIAVVGGNRVVTILADNLKEESSKSISISSDIYKTFGSVQTNFLVEGFVTDLKDVFALRQIKDDDGMGNAVIERYNGSGAFVIGTNVELKTYFSSHFDFQTGLTLQRSQYKSPEFWSDNSNVKPEKKMFRTPDIYGYFTANIELFHKLKAIINGTLTGPMLVQHMQGSGTPIDVAVTTPSFFDTSIRLSYPFKIYNRVNIDATIGLTNIFNSYQRDFDLGYQRDSGYIYGPSLPRSLDFSIAINI